MTAQVYYKGEWIPVSSVNILDVWEGMQGEDTVSFTVGDDSEEHTSKVTVI